MGNTEPRHEAGGPPAPINNFNILPLSRPTHRHTRQGHTRARDTTDNVRTLRRMEVGFDTVVL